MVMTFSELAGLPAKGECCVVLVPPGDTAVHAGLDVELRPRRGFHGFQVPAGRKTAELRKEFLRVLRDGVSAMLVDVTLLPPPKGSELFLAVAKDLHKRKVRSWWLLPDALAEHRSAIAVRERSAAFAVMHAGGQIQFLHAPGIFRPGFFLPRPLVADPAAAATAPRSPHETMLTGLPAALAVFDPQGIPIFTNERAVQEFGLDTDLLRQRPLFSLVAKDSTGRFMRFLSMLRATGSAEMSLTVLDRQRRRRDTEVRARRTADGNIVCLVRESDRREALQQLEDAAGLLESVLEHGSAVQAMFRGTKLLRAGKRFTELVDWLGPSGEFDMNTLLGKRGVELRKTLADTGSLSTDLALVNREGEERRFEFSARLAGSGRQAITHVTLHDVTARERTLRKLEESEGLARELAAATAAGLVVVREGKCSWANRAALELLGFGTVQEIAEREFTEVCGARYREQVKQALQSESAELEIRMLHKNGGNVAVDLLVRPISGGRACILHDVTPVRKLKTELRRAYQQHEIVEPFMRALAGSLDPAQIAATAADSLRRDLKLDAGALLLFRGGTATVASSFGLSERAAEIMAAQTPGEGVPAYMAKTLEPVVSTIASYPAFLPLKSQWEAEGYGVVAYVPLAGNGTLHGLLVLLGTQAEADEDWPWLLGTIGVFLGEALASAFAFQELRAQEELYRGVFSSLPDVTYRCRPHGAVEILSPRMESLFGHKTADFARDPEFWRTVVHPDDRTTYSRRITDQAAGVEAVELFYRMLPRGKAVYRWVRDNVRYERGPDGAVSAVVGLLTVVAGPPGAAAATPPQEAGYRQQDEFASIVSHDLKESLITIEAYSRIVRDEAKLEPELAEHLDRVVAASGRLKNLIDDLATLSLVGRDPGSHQTFPLQKVFAELAEEFEPTVRLRNASLSVPPEAPQVTYDRTQLMMVLRNLVSNGLKFNRSPEPRVEISVRETPEGVTVAVRDNGIGIAPEDFERIFVIFKRLHPSSEFPGTGAGLAIVKRIVERHGGRITVESEGGSTFTFTIPTRRSAT